MATTPQIVFDVSDECDDEEEKGPEIQIRVIPEGYGVALSIVNPFGTEVARVAIDYHSNTLKGLVYLDGTDEPIVHEMVSDVAGAMQPPPPPAKPPEPEIDTRLRWGRSRGTRTWHVITDTPVRHHPQAKEGTDKYLYRCKTACGRDEIIFRTGTMTEPGEKPGYTPGESTVCPDCVNFMREQETK